MSPKWCLLTGAVAGALALWTSGVDDYGSLVDTLSVAAQRACGLLGLYAATQGSKVLHLEQPEGLAGKGCELVAPSAVELRAHGPEDLAARRRLAAVVPSAGGEAEATGFAAGACVVGTWTAEDALDFALSWNETACREICTATPSCLGVLWGRVALRDGMSHRCFLAGAGADANIIEHGPCRSLWGGCEADVTYEALVQLAPSMKCWQRLWHRCPQHEPVSIPGSRAASRGLSASLDLGTASARLSAARVHAERLVHDTLRSRGLAESHAPTVLVTLAISLALLLCAAAAGCFSRRASAALPGEGEVAAEASPAPATPLKAAPGVGGQAGARLSPVAEVPGAGQENLEATPQGFFDDLWRAVESPPADTSGLRTPLREASNTSPEHGSVRKVQVEPSPAISKNELAMVALLNYSKPADLTELPGVGKVSAEKIVQYRRKATIERLSDLEKAGLNRKVIASLESECL